MTTLTVCDSTRPENMYIARALYLISKHHLPLLCNIINIRCIRFVLGKKPVTINLAYPMEYC